MNDDNTAPLDQILFDEDELDGALKVLDNPASGSLDTFEAAVFSRPYRTPPAHPGYDSGTYSPPSE